jgi:hypothetical protein
MKKLAHVFATLALGGTIAGGIAAGCASSGHSIKEDSCTVGDLRDCSCGGLQGGMQTCVAGSWGDCSCADGMPDAASDAPAVCGDNVCESAENCVTCPADCGTCPACSASPSCTGASSVPDSPTALTSFNNAGQTMYTSGVGFGQTPAETGCSDPLLKMRISQIQIHKNGAPDSLELFCLVQADDGQSSQLMLTSDYMNLADDNPAIVLSPSAGTFWGQAVNGVKLSQFNITVTYTCYMVTTPDALQSALMAIAGVATAGSAIPGNPYGWAFGIGGAAAAAAAAATAVGSGASPLLNVQQTIDSGALLKLTNGYTWAIEETGSTKVDGDCDLFESCDWDWELDVEAWGCAAPTGQTPQE